MSNEMQKLLDLLKERYPDVMVTDRMDEFERIKLAGKVELIKEIEFIVSKKPEEK